MQPNAAECVAIVDSLHVLMLQLIKEYQPDSISMKPL